MTANRRDKEIIENLNLEKGGLTAVDDHNPD
jgi:hypothetical protein